MIIVVKSRGEVGGVRRCGGRRRRPLLPHQHRPLLQRTMRILLRHQSTSGLRVLHKHFAQYSLALNKSFQKMFVKRITSSLIIVTIQISQDIVEIAFQVSCSGRDRRVRALVGVLSSSGAVREGSPLIKRSPSTARPGGGG